MIKKIFILLFWLTFLEGHCQIIEHRTYYDCGIPIKTIEKHDLVVEISCRELKGSSTQFVLIRPSTASIISASKIHSRKLSPDDFACFTGPLPEISCGSGYLLAKPEPLKFWSDDGFTDDRQDDGFGSIEFSPIFIAIEEPFTKKILFFSVINNENRFLRISDIYNDEEVENDLSGVYNLIGELAVYLMERLKYKIMVEHEAPSDREIFLLATLLKTSLEDDDQVIDNPLDADPSDFDSNILLQKLAISLKDFLLWRGYGVDPKIPRPVAEIATVS